MYRPPPRTATFLNMRSTAVDQQSHPNWNSFDRVIIFFAQRTDLYGGENGTRLPNGKLAGITVFDPDSGFDQVCQEVGHALGLDHEIDAMGLEYACPYSVMSADDTLVAYGIQPGLQRIWRQVGSLYAVGGIHVYYTTFCESRAREVPYRVGPRLLRSVCGIIDVASNVAGAWVRSRVPDANPEHLLLRDDLLGIADNFRDFVEKQYIPWRLGSLS
jgi:hypothetical protein